MAQNFEAVHRVARSLGVPAMLSCEDYLDDGPDELSTILYVALLSSSLMQVTVESRAALTIIAFLRRRLCWRPGPCQLQSMLTSRHAIAEARVTCGPPCVDLCVPAQLSTWPE